MLVFHNIGKRYYIISYYYIFDGQYVCNTSFDLKIQYIATLICSLFHICTFIIVLGTYIKLYGFRHFTNNTGNDFNRKMIKT